jgi:DNA (cytosine-5)-methyltransferase 1
VRYLSVCSGIEAATVAWHPLGWTAAAYSEIEKFPSQVLAHHYPDVPNVGDMTKFKEWNLGPIDLLVGGTPCQSFSVAGLRKGLDDPRGNLMLTFLAIADQHRPRWLVWENVPGVLSSNGGKDFGTFLGALGELGYGFAYRILDAQYFGVAQRRRRVFVVGHLGDWRAAAAVLFERHSFSGDSAPSREKRKEVTECAGTLTANCGGLNRPAGNANELDFCITVRPIGIFQDSEFGVAHYDNAGTLRAGRIPEHQMVMQQVGAFKPGQSAQAHSIGYENEMAPTLEAGSGGNNKPAVHHGMAVRRLTPVECERLQGFPDKYTDIQPKGKATPDGPRYKALGNSMAVPVMAWIGKRIQEVEQMQCKPNK